MACLTRDNIINNGGVVTENADGTVSVFVNNSGVLIPNQLNKACCVLLKETYIFDTDKQICKWGSGTKITTLTEPVKITVNPINNDGALFLISSDESCALNVSFDYLFNISCENLYAILNDTTVNSAQVEIIQNIKLYTGLVENNEEDCEILDNKIAEIKNSIELTNYSIFCDKIPIVKIAQNVVALNTDNIFSNTAFGKNLVTKQDTVLPNTQYDTVNYCLTEPTGLDEWSKILGTKYQAFLDGSPTSYTCDDVIALKAVQDKIGGVLFPCDVPFGTKSKLVNDLKTYSAEKVTCENNLAALEAALVNFNAQLLVVGDSIITAPIDFFETLDVSVTIEVINGATLQTVFTDNFFPAIGHGNLYNHLTTKEASGFYVCGTDIAGSIGLSGCTPFLLPTLAVIPPTNIGPCDDVIKEPRNNASSCDLINASITKDLFIESGLDDNTSGKTEFAHTLPNNALVSNWLNYNFSITDAEVLELIRDKKVKLTVNINKIGSDFCVLLDNIVLDRDCEKVITHNLFVTESPSFNLEKIVDNKKSWNNKVDSARRFLIASNQNTNLIRETDYEATDDRLIINTKEVDLNINIAAAIENDVWRYILDNPCLLSAACLNTIFTGTTTATTYHKQFEDVEEFDFEDDDYYCFEDDPDCTGSTHIIITSRTESTCCDPCACVSKQFQDDDCFFFQDLSDYNFQNENGNSLKSLCCGDQNDFSKLIFSPFSAITTISDFISYVSTELIDAKNRQTILGYATLRALYDRYLKSSFYCANPSSAFSYMTIEGFSKLVGDYWSDIVEQVVPATTIWGSVKIYSNTVFDQQKFKYKSYTALFGANPYHLQKVSSPVFGEAGACQSVDVLSVNIDVAASGETIGVGIGDGKFNKVCIAQMNMGSEFIGSVQIQYGTTFEIEENAAVSIFHLGKYSS